MSSDKARRALAGQIGGSAEHANKAVQIATLRGFWLEFQIVSVTHINIQETKWLCR
jgi:hypothetical protein